MNINDECVLIRAKNTTVFSYMAEGITKVLLFCFFKSPKMTFLLKESVILKETDLTNRNQF